MVMASTATIEHGAKRFVFCCRTHLPLYFHAAPDESPIGREHRQAVQVAWQVLCAHQRAAADRDYITTCTCTCTCTEATLA